MLVHPHLSMSGTWPHSRLGHQQQWTNYDSNQQCQSQVGSNEARIENNGRQGPESSELTAPNASEVPAPAIEHQTALQSTRGLGSPTSRRESGYEATPSISISSEAHVPTPGRSEDGEQANDEDRVMEAEGSTAGEEEDDVGEEPAEGENGGVEKTMAERWADKRKMKRFRLTHNQTRFLMSEFARQAHPDAAQRERLSREIPGLSPRQVQVWFQNRRAKLKRLTTDDRERMMRSRALPDNFDMTKALHSPLMGEPIQPGPPQTLPRPYSLPATSLNYNASLGDLSTIREPHRHMGPDSAVETIPPSPMSGHSDYYHPSPSSGTISGNQSPSSPGNLSAVGGYNRSSFGYRPHFPHAPGNFSHSMYVQPPRSVGPHDHAAGVQQGGGSPSQHHASYMGSVDHPSPTFQAGMKTPTSIPTSMPTTMAYTSAYRPTADSSKHSRYPSDYDPRLNGYNQSQQYGGVAQPPSHPPTLAPPNPLNRMRSHTSPSGHSSAYGSPSQPGFPGPYSAPLAHPPAASAGAGNDPGRGVPFSPRAPYSPQYGGQMNSPKVEAGPTDSQQQQGMSSYYGTPGRATPQTPGLNMYRVDHAEDGGGDEPRRQSGPIPSAHSEHPA